MRKTTANLLKVLQDKLSTQILELFESVVLERRKYYESGQAPKPDAKTLDKLITSYANTNAGISGGAHILPGPLGMTAVVPEIVLVLRNQLRLIYDVGMAHGQEKVLDKHLLAGILLAYSGSKGLEFLSLEGGKLLMRESSVQVLQRIATMVGLNVSEQLVSSMLLSYVPLAGAAAMAAWSRYSTQKLGRYASEMLSKPIEKQAQAPTLVEAKPELLDTAALRELHLQVLIYLMHIDGKPQAEESRFMEAMIEAAELDSKRKLALVKLMGQAAQTEPQVAPFQGQDLAIKALLFDALALMRTDGQSSLAERLYIQSLAEQFAWSKADIAVLLQA